MKIQRLSTCSFKLYSPGGKVVMIDPWLTNDPLWPKAENAELLKQFPVQESYKKVEKFMQVLEKDYPHIKGIYVPIGAAAEI